MDVNTDMARHPLGTAQRYDDGGEVLLRFERSYAHPIEAVWAAFTDPAQTEKWWARTRGTPRTGGPWDLQWLNAKDEGHGTELDWWNGRVRSASAPHVFEISNSMHGIIRAELSPGADDGTLLVFTNTISVPDEVVLMSLAGWHVHLDHLQEALAGESIDWPNWWRDFHPAWEAIHAAYERDASR